MFKDIFLESSKDKRKLELIKKLSSKRGEVKDFKFIGMGIL